MRGKRGFASWRRSLVHALPGDKIHYANLRSASTPWSVSLAIRDGGRIEGWISLSGIGGVGHRHLALLRKDRSSAAIEARGSGGGKEGERGIRGRRIAGFISACAARIISARRHLCRLPSKSAPVSA